MLLNYFIAQYSQSSSYKIMDKRILNEIRILKASKYRNNFSYIDIKGTFTFIIRLLVVHKASMVKSAADGEKIEFKIFIDTKDCYPFKPPQIYFDYQLNDVVFDPNKLVFEEIMQENWHPSLRVIDIIQRAEEFIIPLVKRSIQKSSIFCPILYLFKSVTSSISVKAVIILSAIFIRIVCNLMYYETSFRSHYNTITHTMNHRIVDWYAKGDGHEFQTYPPLYGYIYYLIGIVQSLILDTPDHELMKDEYNARFKSSLDFRINNYV
jgi:ubiquitin-protein ligase